MTPILEHQVKRDNSNIRCFSDSLWRALRKERYKPAKPDAMTNQMAAEQLSWQRDAHSDFEYDINKFIDNKLSDREAKILRMFLFGGGLTQTEIAESLGVCQATVASVLKSTLDEVRRGFYGCC